MRGGFTPSHIIILAIVVLVLFGAGKLQGFTRSLMQSARIVKAEAKAMKDEDGTHVVTPVGQIASTQQLPVVTPVVPPVATPVATPVDAPVAAPLVPPVAEPIAPVTPPVVSTETPVAPPRTDG